MKDKSTHVFQRVALAGLAATLLFCAMPAQDFNVYHNYAEMTAMLQRFSSSHTDLAHLFSLGKTYEKRDIWLLEIANPTGMPLAERPALLIAANLEGDHVIGSELALFIADYLLKNNSTNAAVKEALAQTVIYIMPRVNPDGAECYWKNPKGLRRTNANPIDDDNDGRSDEDGPADLNQDGWITVMRVKDPHGEYIADPDNARLLKKADPKKGERGMYKVYWEGVDHDGDGFIAEDGPGGVNINRNFMHEYPFYKPEAGRFMASENETRAILEWLVSHRNVAMIFTFGEHDNLIVPPNSRGQLAAARIVDMFEFANAANVEAGKTGIFANAQPGRRMRDFGGEMSDYTPNSFSNRLAPQQSSQQQPRMPMRTPATTVNVADIDYFKTISAKYGELTGIKQLGVVYKAEGAFFQFGYYQFGVPSFSTPGWGLPPIAATPHTPAQNQPPSAPPAGQRRAAATPGAAETESAAQGIDAQLLQWLESEKIAGFVEWQKVAHPEFGTVEIGGFKAYAIMNPPAQQIAALGASHAAFAVYLSSLLPHIKIAKYEALNHGGGIFEIKAEIENTGFLPTSLAHAVSARAVKPIMVQLQVEPAAIISGNPKTNHLDTLNGSGGRAKFSWVIKAQPGDTIALKVVSQKSGTAHAQLALK